MGNPGIFLRLISCYAKVKKERASSYLRYLGLMKRPRKNGGVLAMAAGESTLIGQELKYSDVSFSQSMSSAWGFVEPAANCYNALELGDGGTDRNGRRVFIHSVSIRGILGRPSYASILTGPMEEQLVRIVIFFDRQANGAQGIAEDLFNDDSLNILNFHSLERAARYQILLDRMFHIPANSGEAQELEDLTEFVSGETRLAFNMEIGFGDDPVEVTYKASTGNVTDIVSNALHMVGVARTTVGSFPTLKGVVRIRYEG